MRTRGWLIILAVASASLALKTGTGYVLVRKKYLQYLNLVKTRLFLLALRSSLTLPLQNGALAEQGRMVFVHKRRFPCSASLFNSTASFCQHPVRRDGVVHPAAPPCRALPLCRALPPS